MQIVFVEAGDADQARSVSSLAEAVEIVQVAVDVKAEIGSDLGESPTALHKSLEILGAIHRSLGIDLPPTDVCRIARPYCADGDLNAAREPLVHPVSGEI